MKRQPSTMQGNDRFIKKARRTLMMQRHWRTLRKAVS